MRSSIDDTYFDIQLTISEDKKHLTVFSNNYGEYENNLFDELNNFIEYDFSIIYQFKGRLEQIYNEIEFWKNDFSDLYKYQDFINICKDIAKSFERDLPGLYMSLDTMLEDKFSLTDCYTIDLITSMDKIWYELENIAVMQRDIEGLFYNLAEQQLNYIDRSKTLVSQHYTTFVTEMILTYDYGEFSYKVMANTPQLLYASLVVFYFSSHPSIALCRYCGRYFTPKTKKVTLYCDRATENNSICKIEGARLKYKNKTEGDPVLHKYTREKHRRYMACDRSGWKSQESDSTFDKYYCWLDIAQEKLEKYKTGLITANEMMRFLN